MESDISHMNKLLDICTNDYEAAEKDVEKFREQLKCAVDHSCDALMRELEQEQNESYSKLQNATSDLGTHVKNPKRGPGVIQTRIQGGNLNLHPYHLDTASSLPLPQSKPLYLCPTFVPNKNLIGAIASSIGEINYEKVKIEYMQEEEMVSTPVPTVCTTTIKSFLATICGSSIEPVGNDKAWLSSLHSKSLHLYDVCGIVDKSITVEESKGIIDIAVKRTGDLIVTCRDKKVRHVNMTGRITVLLDGYPFTPSGVCLREDEDIVVCMAGQGDKNHVAVYSADGQSKIRDIVARDDKGRILFSNPTRVVINGVYVTVLSFRSNVLNFNEHGKMIWVYDGSQTTLKEAFDPWGMCKDKYSNILVSDRCNHCVHRVNSEGKLLQIIEGKDNGIQYPWGIGVSSDDDKLWLGKGVYKKVWVVSYRTK